MCRKSETKVLVLCDLKESRYPYMVMPGIQHIHTCVPAAQTCCLSEVLYPNKLKRLV